MKKQQKEKEKEDKKDKELRCRKPSSLVTMKTQVGLARHGRDLEVIENRLYRPILLQYREAQEPRAIETWCDAFLKNN